ncbi:MAG: hypothetical protein N2513_00120 [Deltaproteobacteria bacterium]|nr:hypothetical protein [Deltaproteobacteria bacterium]
MNCKNREMFITTGSNFGLFRAGLFETGEQIGEIFEVYTGLFKRLVHATVFRQLFPIKVKLRIKNLTFDTLYVVRDNIFSVKRNSYFLKDSYESVLYEYRIPGLKSFLKSNLFKPFRAAEITDSTGNVIFILKSSFGARKYDLFLSYSEEDRIAHIELETSLITFGRIKGFIRLFSDNETYMLITLFCAIVLMLMKQKR